MTQTDPASAQNQPAGAFLDHPLWELPERPQWKTGLPVLRAATRRQAAALATSRSIPPLGRACVVVSQLLWAVGTWLIIGRRKGGSQSRRYLAKRLRVAAERLGPTYIKLCQILSSGEGLFLDELVEEMKKCRDKVPPQDWDTVRETIEAELGCPISNRFEFIDHTPLAAASIAQVHQGRLRQPDGSTVDVVIKVQRSDIRRQVSQDLRVMSAIAPFLVGRIPVAALANPPALVDLFAETISEELDFRLEAENMLDLSAVFGQIGGNGFAVPRPHPELVTRRMLVMEKFVGYEFDDVEGMKAGGIDTHEVVRTGMRGFTEGCMIHGIFHGDLHGGNLMVLTDGRIGLLDYGICARMTPTERVAFLKLMLAGAAGDIPTQITAFRDLGALPTDTDIDALIVDLGLDQAPVDPTQMGQGELVEEIQRIVKTLMASGARLPKVLMLYVKNLVFLDGAISTLAPDLDLLAVFSELSTHLTMAHGAQIAKDIGTDPATLRADPEAIKASFGIVDPDIDTVSYADLKKRREIIQRRLSKQHNR